MVSCNALTFKETCVDVDLLQSSVIGAEDFFKGHVMSGKCQRLNGCGGSISLYHFLSESVPFEYHDVMTRETQTTDSSDRLKVSALEYLAIPELFVTFTVFGIGRRSCLRQSISQAGISRSLFLEDNIYRTCSFELSGGVCYLPAICILHYTTIYGPFPYRIDGKTSVTSKSNVKGPQIYREIL